MNPYLKIHPINFIKGMSMALELTNIGISNHHCRTSIIAKAIAESIHLPQHELETLIYASLLHDIGKLAVSNEIINKPGKLTEEEYTLIKQHPYYSYRILQQIEGFEQISNWVGQHHESFNGEGYPYKLCSDRISLDARILTVDDVFCALTEDRPYRKMLTLEQTFEIIDEMTQNLKIDPNIYKYIRLYPDEVISLLENQRNA
ncbi:HD-GYP domain-containing protein [Clostridium magnum]|uniref:Cyclic di-GMP phosphodiesterase response regulator RpfG n=1 Tax=Clostridium magnum DSM 2767 TaxID=1121326 RepID=A0A162RPQ1_9CLOT|nr:HD domain-containing phosphohydrolase [Clostridium magnum]KZL90210.1 cyclic di-GMP phosphodiesterase response regulator RpfG [Clostridium magnum DSM 2767]SHI14244.1 HDIG domain-containing protein [Clostridium magnum DSM 2767]